MINTHALCHDTACNAHTNGPRGTVGCSCNKKVERLEAENALLKKKLEMALQGIEHYGDESFWDDPHEDSGYERATLYNFEDEFDGPLSGYELARRIKAEIEEVK